MNGAAVMLKVTLERLAEVGSIFTHFLQYMEIRHAGFF